MADLQLEEVIAIAEDIKPSDDSTLDVDENVPDLPPEIPSSPPPSFALLSPIRPVEDASFTLPPSPAPRSLYREENNNSALVEDKNLSKSATSTPTKQQNIGSKIVEHHVKEQRSRDVLRNQTLELEDDGVSFEELERERLQVIENQKKTVKPKRIDNWLRRSQEAEDDSSEVPKAPLDGESEVVYESILANKEKTKSSWEARMLGLNNKMSAALEPPPGFESAPVTVNGHVRLEDFTDDFIEVGAVVVEGVELDEDPLLTTVSPTRDQGIVPEPVKEEPKLKQKNSNFPATYFDQTDDYSNRDIEHEDELSVGKSNKINQQETLIEREIRLQKEREEALAFEREMALRKTRTTPKLLPSKVSIPQDFQDNIPPLKKVPEAVEDKKIIETKKSSSEVSADLSPAEARISQEIRELRQREEELRAQRVKLLTKQDNTEESDNMNSIPTIDEGHYSDTETPSEERDFISETNSSRVATPEMIQGSSEYSKFPHQRTQSMDSMSSGHSSGDHVLSVGDGVTSVATTPANYKGKRQVIVKPFDEPEDEESTPAYRRVLKETPIEREIRLAREREEALRREKGVPAWAAAVTQKNTDKDHRVLTRMTSADKRDVQHRIATSRIQMEIEETVEREKELISAGTIQTTSEDRVDDKVTRVGQLDSFPEPEAPKERRPLAKSVSTPSLFHEHQPIAVIQKDEAPPTKIDEEPITKSRPHFTRALSSTTGPVNALPAQPLRKFSNPVGPQRGLMQKFLATRGRMPVITQSAFAPAGQGHAEAVPRSSQGHAEVTPRSSQGDHGLVASTPPLASSHINPPSLQAVLDKDEVQPVVEEAKPVLRNPPPRRTYATAEEKIQAELREMQKREEELRANRMKLFAKSQPNLLAAIDAEDEPETRSYLRSRNHSSIKSAVSIPDLLNAEDSKLPVSRTLNQGPRRKSALIAQWENMIQQTNQ